MKRPWLYYSTPCLLAAVFFFYIMMYTAFEPPTDKHDGEDWWFIFFVVFIPVIIILLAVDYLIKSLTKGKLLYIWIIEGVLIAILFIWLWKPLDLSSVFKPYRQVYIMFRCFYLQQVFPIMRSGTVFGF